MTFPTIAFHICEKTSGNIVHVPSVPDVYAQIIAADNGFTEEILLNPEYNGHAVWEDESAWIIANFSSIPVMIDVAGGWSNRVTTDKLDALKAAGVDIKWIRIAELASWCIEHSEVFPDVYVNGLLAWCVANNTRLYWCEWKLDYGDSVKTFEKILELYPGFEEVIYPGFKTNSGDAEPLRGIQYVKHKGFTHIGATVESWYWETRHRTEVWEPSEGLESPDNMPISWMVRHLKEVQMSGAEIVQFEPYWWFFNKSDGTQLGTALVDMFRYLRSSQDHMDNSRVILETIRAEWASASPSKNKIDWSYNRVDHSLISDVQPSVDAFRSNPSKVGISASSIGISPVDTGRNAREIVALEVLVKTAGTTLENAKSMRQDIAHAIEGIIHAYSKGNFWAPDPGPLGDYKPRRIPGIDEVQVLKKTIGPDNGSIIRLTIQISCKINQKVAL